MLDHQMSAMTHSMLPREGMDYPVKDKQDWLTNRLQASNFPVIYAKNRRFEWKSLTRTPLR